jgi:hypothetical protein
LKEGLPKLRRRDAAPPFRPRPQSSAYETAEAFRSDLKHWLDEAVCKHREMTVNPGSTASEPSAGWLEFEIRAARHDLVLLVRDLALGHWDSAGESPFAVGEGPEP